MWCISLKTSALLSFCLLDNCPVSYLEYRGGFFEFNSKISKKGVPILKDFEKICGDFEGFRMDFELPPGSPALSCQRFLT